MTRLFAPMFLIALAAVILLRGSASASAPGAQSVSFHREVVNLETFSDALGKTAPFGSRHLPAEGDIRYGQILRQLPGDDPASRVHNVTFAVRLEDSKVVRAWCDANMNGDLGDDPAPPLSAYPGPRAGRSFLTDLRWNAHVGGRDLPIDRLVRVVVFDPDTAGASSVYHTQDVYGMLGTVGMEGVKRLALLFDANSDGLYTRGHSDGVFFDLDNDRHFTIDMMKPDFGPFATPFSIDHRDYTVDSVDLEGRRIVLQDHGPSAPAIVATVGLPAPDFSYMDVRGRPVRLSSLRGRTAIIYFWSSRCGSCQAHADELRTLYDHYDRSQLEILAVNYDHDRKAMEAFRAQHRHTWPTSFSGGYPAQDPVGRLYGEMGAGVYYVVAPDGKLTARDYDIATLTSDLQKSFGSARGTLGSSR